MSINKVRDDLWKRIERLIRDGAKREVVDYTKGIIEGGKLQTGKLGTIQTFLQFRETTTPAIPGTDNGLLYAKDNAGDTDLYWQGSDGIEHDLLTPAALSGYIPYTGATSDVDLGTHKLTTTGTVGFGQAATSTPLSVYRLAGTPVNIIRDQTTTTVTTPASTMTLSNLDNTNGNFAQLGFTANDATTPTPVLRNAAGIKAFFTNRGVGLITGQISFHAVTAGSGTTIPQIATMDGGGFTLVTGVITAATYIGGIGTGSTLTLKSTSGIGATDAIIFQVGNNGATEVMRLLNSGNIVIGLTTNSIAKLRTSHSTSGTVLNYGVYSTNALTQAVGASAFIVGLRGDTTLTVTSGTNSNSLGATGLYGRATADGAGTLAVLQAFYSSVLNTGPGTVTTAYCYRVESALNNGGGTITNAYGIYCDPQTAGSSINAGIRILAPALDANIGTTSISVGLYMAATSSSMGDQNATTATAAMAYFGIVTYTAINPSRTITNLSTVYIQGAPVASTNILVTTGPYALWVDSGTTRLDGDVLLAARILESQGVDVASANNLVLGAAGNTFEITGTTQINLIANTGWQNGSIIRLLFTAALTLKHNQAPSGANIPIYLSGGADYVTAAESRLTLVLSEIGGTQAWREIGRLNPVQYVYVSFPLGDDTNVITTGVKIPKAVGVPAGTLVEVRLVTSGAVGNITVDLLRATYAAFPTFTSIVGAATKPNIANAAVAQKYSDTTFTSWTSTALAEGDMIQAQVTATATLVEATLILKIRRG